MELTELPFSFARLLLVASVQRPPEPGEKTVEASRGGRRHVIEKSAPD